MKLQTVHIFGGQQHRQNARAGHAFFNLLSRLVRLERRGLAVAATVDFTSMFDHPDLHRHDFKLLADFLANGIFSAAADAGQFMLGRFMDDFDARQIGRYWFVLATAFGGNDDPFFNVLVRQINLVFRFIAQCHLRSRWVDRLHQEGCRARNSCH